MLNIKLPLGILFPILYARLIPSYASHSTAKLVEEIPTLTPASSPNIEEIIPNEVLLHCFSYLSPQETLRAAQVCKRWRALADADMQWINLAKKEYPYWAKVIIGDGKNVKQRFVRCYLQDFLEDIGVRDLLTTADCNKLGIISLNTITSVICEQNDCQLIIWGKNDLGNFKKFTCDFTDILIINSSTNSLLPFVADDGEKVWLRCFDASGYDTTTYTEWGLSFRPNLLVAELLNKIMSIYAIHAIYLSAINNKEEN